MPSSAMPVDVTADLAAMGRAHGEREALSVAVASHRAAQEAGPHEAPQSAAQAPAAPPRPLDGRTYRLGLMAGAVSLALAWLSAVVVLALVVAVALVPEVAPLAERALTVWGVVVSCITACLVAVAGIHGARHWTPWGQP